MLSPQIQHMFTIDQIRAAHNKVASGADFPAYVRELKALGVRQFEVFVVDGHTDFTGAGHYQVRGAAEYQLLTVALQPHPAQFIADLKTHQAGNTGYLQFCRDAAASGVEKWIMNLEAMTCTYFDKAGNEVLVENIPQ